MDAEAILNEVGDKQGWDEDSKLALCLRYIENQKDPECFKGFLQQQADLENETAPSNDDEGQSKEGAPQQ